MKRLSSKVLKVDPRIKKGYYSDMYFNRTNEILEKDNHHPILRMQVFQRNDDAILCGVDEAIGIVKEAMEKDFVKLKVRALHDGDKINAWETAMFIEGDYSLYPHLETVYLGALARGTKVATNTYRCVKAANGKPVLFFPARFDTYRVQAKDGYSYKIGREAAGKSNGGVSTDAQGEWWGSPGLGTIPHALIAAYGGDTALATLKFAEHVDPKIKRISLVDFENNCVRTTMDVAQAMLARYKETKDERYILTGVRLDTSGNMVDSSIEDSMGQAMGNEKPTGVNPKLVMNVHEALQKKANEFAEASLERKFYQGIGIVVSGGFVPEKIRRFEELKLPVMAYGVGSSMFNGNFDFTADIVSRCEKGIWMPNAKVGRLYLENPRLEEVIEYE